MGWKCGACRDSGPEHNAISCPSCDKDTPTPTDDDGFTAADWLAQGTEHGDAMYERARKRILFRDIDPTLTAFYDAVKDPRHDFLLVRDTRPGLDNRVIASSDDFSRAASA